MAHRQLAKSRPLLFHKSNILEAPPKSEWQIAMLDPERIFQIQVDGLSSKSKSTEKVFLRVLGSLPICGNTSNCIFFGLISKNAKCFKITEETEEINYGPNSPKSHYVHHVINPDTQIVIGEYYTSGSLRGWIEPYYGTLDSIYWKLGQFSSLMAPIDHSRDIDPAYNNVIIYSLSELVDFLVHKMEKELTGSFPTLQDKVWQLWDGRKISLFVSKTEGSINCSYQYHIYKRSFRSDQLDGFIYKEAALNVLPTYRPFHRIITEWLINGNKIELIKDSSQGFINFEWTLED